MFGGTLESLAFAQRTYVRIHTLHGINSRRRATLDSFSALAARHECYFMKLCKDLWWGCFTGWLKCLQANYVIPGHWSKADATFKLPPKLKSPSCHLPRPASKLLTVILSNISPHLVNMSSIIKLSAALLHRLSSIVYGKRSERILLSHFSHGSLVWVQQTAEVQRSGVSVPGNLNSNVRRRYLSHLEENCPVISACIGSITVVWSATLKVVFQFG